MENEFDRVRRGELYESSESQEEESKEEYKQESDRRFHTTLESARDSKRSNMEMLRSARRGSSNTILSKFNFKKVESSNRKEIKSDSSLSECSSLQSSFSDGEQWIDNYQSALDRHFFTTKVSDCQSLLWRSTTDKNVIENMWGNSLNVEQRNRLWNTLDLPV